MPLRAVNIEHYGELFTDKCAVVEALLAPFRPPPADCIPSPPSGFRMRAEFRLWHQGDELHFVMFSPDDPKTPVAVDHFPIACADIQTLMPRLLQHLRMNPELRRKVFQVEFLATLAGDTLVTLIYHRKLEPAWQQCAAALARDLGVAVVGRSRKQKLVITRDFVTESLTIAGRNYRYRQYEQAFTQPNAEVNIRMIEWALSAVEELHNDLLELYCGNGNFTLPLAQQFDRVIATELAKTSIEAARWNLEANDISNVAMVRLAAEEVSQAVNGTRSFRRLASLPQPLNEYRLNTVLVDPPRAGLDQTTLDMVASFQTILYISCNPSTLAANLKQLKMTHKIARLALFDQFPYTPHMECGVLLQRQ